MNPETRRPDRPVPAMAGAVVHLLGTAIGEGWDVSWVRGVLADTA